MVSQTCKSCLYFSKVRPLSAEHSRKHPKPTHFS